MQKLEDITETVNADLSVNKSAASNGDVSAYVSFGVSVGASVGVLF